MRYLLALYVLLAAVTLASDHRMFIPKNCLGKVVITDFGKPCKPINDHEATCDKVRITFHCVSYKPSDLQLFEPRDFEPNDNMPMIDMETGPWLMSHT